ncbi:MAG: Trm112 family protein [Tepidisphaeraceae bacterium]
MELRPLDAQLLQMLRCPITLSKLTVDGDWLVTEVGGLRYPVRNGIPVMLPEEAQLPEGIASLDEFRKRFHRPR